MLGDIASVIFVCFWDQIEQTPVRSFVQVVEQLESAIAAGFVLVFFFCSLWDLPGCCSNEGLVLKDLNSVYLPGSRGSDWVKMKPDYSDEQETLDCILLGPDVIFEVFPFLTNWFDVSQLRQVVSTARVVDVRVAFRTFCWAWPNRPPVSTTNLNGQASF